MKYLLSIVAMLLLGGCGYTYIYSPKNIRVTSPSAKVSISDTDQESFSENNEDSTSNTTNNNN